ncbi:hypothetical protein KAR91_03035, partial [Candidatus Pacearchaeota archaeon]|nr:hypothetical protein [Candidatus Pacearchaeota archaeon]
MEQINITKGKDKFLWIPIIKQNGGNFDFSDANLSDVVCNLYDSSGALIASYSKTANTLVPVIISYAADGSPESTANDSTNIFEIMLVSTTTTGKASGFIKAEVTIIWGNINLPDNTYDDGIPPVNTDYYLVDTLG